MIITLDNASAQTYSFLESLFFETSFCLVRQLTGKKACCHCGAVFETHSNDEWHLENDV